jgi:cobalt/nickel transport system ATP-binding protein
MIEIKNLDYNYTDGSRALKGVSLDLNQGSVIGVIGANGAGKSTLFLNIMGILRPTGGEVQFEGAPLKYVKSFLNNYRQQVGIVFQDPDKQIFFSNVYDDVAFALRNAGCSEPLVKERVEEALSAMDLLAVRNKPVHLLSYGQKKRVSIAGVLAMDGKVVLLDEPSAGLDPAMKEGIVQVIRLLQQKGKKVVVTSHDMDFIYRITDYVYVLRAGENHMEGPPEQVFLEEEVLISCGLEIPWLIKVHRHMNLPAFKEETALYQYWREHSWRS